MGKGRVQQTMTARYAVTQRTVKERRVLDDGAVFLGRRLVVAVDLARVRRLVVDGHVVTHFARLPLVGERRHRRLDGSLRCRHVVALVLVERAAQALKHIHCYPPVSTRLSTVALLLIRTGLATGCKFRFAAPTRTEPKPQFSKPNKTGSNPFQPV